MTNMSLKLLHIRAGHNPINFLAPKVIASQRQCQFHYLNKVFRNSLLAVPEKFAMFAYPIVPMATEEEILAFAEWAFGPKGLQSLIILAYGNFAEGDRNNSYIYCRSSVLERGYETTDNSGKVMPSFRKMTVQDDYMWNFVPKGSTFLKECREYPQLF